MEGPLRRHLLSDDVLLEEVKTAGAMRSPPMAAVRARRCHDQRGKSPAGELTELGQVLTVVTVATGGAQLAPSDRQPCPESPESRAATLPIQG